MQATSKTVSERLAIMRAGRVEARRCIDDNVAIVRHQHVEQAHKFRGGGINRRGNVGSSQELQAAVVASHEAFEQGSIHAVQVSRCVGYREHRLQVHVQCGVAERGKIDQRGLSVG